MAPFPNPIAISKSFMLGKMRKISHTTAKF
jgi:hypothetical protein